MRQSLILACSATKRKDPGKLQALDRYDGPAFRVLRANWPRGHWLEPPAILSAEHGLINSGFPIEDYDRRMTAARARELIDPTYERLVERVNLGELCEPFFFFGGEAYRNCFRQAVQLAEIDLQGSLEVTYTRGSIGCQLGQLKAWLRRDGQ